MKVFKAFLTILKYYFPMLLIYLGVFIVITIIFTNMNTISNVFEFSSERANLAIIDNDSSALSESLVGLLEDKHNVKEIDNDSQAQTDALYNRKIDYIITIPANFEKNFIAETEIPKLITQSVPNTYSSIYVARLLDSYLNTTKAYLEIGVDIGGSIANALEDMSKNATVEFQDDDKSTREPIFFFYSYMPYAIMMVCILGIGVVLLALFKKPIAMRTNASALSLTRKNSELGLGVVVMSAIILAVFIIFGFIMHGTTMLTSGSLICMVNTIVFIIFSVALAFLIGVLAKNINVINGAANALGLAMCFIGGVFVPREVMSEQILDIAKFVPTYWYVNAVETVAYGDGLNAKFTSSIAIDMLIQLLFAAALITIAMVVSKQKRRVA